MSVVLAVDDDPALCRALVITLRAHGYDVAVARDGMTALADAADLDPPLVILDLGLPDMDGIKVLHGIRKRSRVPIVVLSARSTSQEKLRMAAIGNPRPQRRHAHPRKEACHRRMGK